MKFNKTMLLAPVAAFVMMAGTAQAATNAQVVITGQIAAASCDLSVTQSNIDLGTVISSDITSAGAIASTSKDFTLHLSNCSSDHDGTSPAMLTAKGSPLVANTDYFSNVASGTVGVQLKAGAQAIKPNASTSLTVWSGLTKGGSAQVVMNAQLYSTVATPASQQIEAPVTFSITYN